MTGPINQMIIQKALLWGYEKALTGGGVLGSAYNLADEYVQKNGSNRQAAASLVNWQVAKSATTGFVTGLGGVITLPVAIPANIATVLFLQLRMITAIAIIGGHNPKSDRVQALAFSCLTGNAANEVLSRVGVRVGERATGPAFEAINAQIATKVNQLVSLRLFAKFGRAGVLNFGRAVPLVGGLVCGTIDAASTKVIGRTASRLFLGTE